MGVGVGRGGGHDSFACVRLSTHPGSVSGPRTLSPICGVQHDSLAVSATLFL